MKNKKAYISIEATFAISAILIVLSIIIGLFGFMVPRMLVEKEVQNISHIVRSNGGLTQEQYADAMIALQPYGDSISISIFPSGREGESLVGVAPRGTPNSMCNDPLLFAPFSRRMNSERIIVRVEMRLRAQGLADFLDSIGITALNDRFVVHKTVISERNQC